MLEVVLQSESEVTDVCGRGEDGDGPSWICQTIYESTDSETLARLSDVVFGKVAGILLVVLVAWLANVMVRRAISRFAARLGAPSATEKISKIRRRAPSMMVDSSVVSTRAAARTQTLAQILRSMASVVIWSIAAMTILGELGIDLAPLVASAGIAGVALGFGAQSLVKDVISGFFMLVEDQYGVGDIVDVGAASADTLASGAVEAVSLRTTRIRDVNGTVWHIPNGTIERVGNKSQQWARALVDVNVAYGTDVDHAQRIIKETADSVWNDEAWDGVILEEPEVWGVEQLSNDAIQIRLVVKTQPAEQFRVTRELRRRILQAFTANGVEIGQTTVLVRDTDDRDDTAAATQARRRAAQPPP